MHDVIYINGCSYSTVSNGNRYSEFLSKHYNCPVINNAAGGSCNKRILRSSVRDLIDLQKKYKNITVILSLSFLLRTEVWDPLHTREKFRELNDGDFISLQAAHSKTSAIKDSIQHDRYKKFVTGWLEWYDAKAETINLLTELIMFTGWCKTQGIRYIIFSGPPQQSVDFTTSDIKLLYDTISKDPNILDMFNLSFTEYCINNNFVPIDEFTQDVNGTIKIVGHHGESAHKQWARFLIENYIDEKN